MGIGEKLLLYGGYFYLTLVLCSLLYFFVPLRLRLLFIKLILFTCAFFTLVAGLKEIVYRQDIEQWYLPIPERIQKTTLGLNDFTNEINQKIPNDTKVCLKDSWDIPTKFIQQRLYPKNVTIVKDLIVLPRACDYLIIPVISHFVENIPEFVLIENIDNNLLYKRGL